MEGLRRVCHSPCKALTGCFLTGVVAQLEDAEDLLEEEGDVATAEAAAVAEPAAAQGESSEFKAGAEAFASQCAHLFHRDARVFEGLGNKEVCDGHPTPSQAHHHQPHSSPLIDVFALRCWGAAQAWTLSESSSPLRCVPPRIRRDFADVRPDGLQTA